MAFRSLLPSQLLTLEPGTQPLQLRRCQAGLLSEINPASFTPRSPAEISPASFSPESARPRHRLPARHRAHGRRQVPARGAAAPAQPAPGNAGLGTDLRGTRRPGRLRAAGAPAPTTAAASWDTVPPREGRANCQRPRHRARRTSSQHCRRPAPANPACPGCIAAPRGRLSSAAHPNVDHPQPPWADRSPVAIPVGHR